MAAKAPSTPAPKVAKVTEEPQEPQGRPEVPPAATDGAETQPADEAVVPAPVIRSRDRVEIMVEDTPPGDYVPRPLPRIMAVANQKGGVGKTTTAVNLGAALAEIGYRVLVVDLDPQGNATTGLGIDARNFELSMYDVIMRDTALEDAIEPTSMKNLFVAPATIDLAGAEIELVPVVQPGAQAPQGPRAGRSTTSTSS